MTCRHHTQAELGIILTIRTFHSFLKASGSMVAQCRSEIQLDCWRTKLSGNWNLLSAGRRHRLPRYRTAARRHRISVYLLWQLQLHSTLIGSIPYPFIEHFCVRYIYIKTWHRYLQLFICHWHNMTVQKSHISLFPHCPLWFPLYGSMKQSPQKLSMAWYKNLKKGKIIQIT